MSYCQPSETLRHMLTFITEKIYITLSDNKSHLGRLDVAIDDLIKHVL